MLHRLILAQCSGFFEAGTSEEWSRAQARAQGGSLSRIGEDDESGSELGRCAPSSQSVQNTQFRWRYELDWGTNDDEVPMLVQKVGLF